MKNNVNPEFQMKIDALMEDDYDDDFYGDETGGSDTSNGGAVLSEEEERILRGGARPQDTRPQSKKRRSKNPQPTPHNPQDSRKRQRPRKKLRDLSINDYKRKSVIYRFIALALVAIIVILLCRTVIRKMNQGMPVDTTEISDETIAFKVDNNIEGLSE